MRGKWHDRFMPRRGLLSASMLFPEIADAFDLVRRIIFHERHSKDKPMHRTINIGGRIVGDGHPTYIVAECGINHGGSLKTALALIDAAVEAGADAVKFQTYLSEKRAPAHSPIFGILKKCELPLRAFAELQAYAESKKIGFFSTPFDEESLHHLESIGCTHYKIASFDITNRKLLQAVAETRRPVFLSTGMADLEEVEEAFRILSRGTNDIALLHCVSAYPTAEKDANLAAIYTLRADFDCVIGQSDHTPDIAVPLYAVAAGARVLEKHFKIDAAMDCVDTPVSIDRKQMTALVTETRRLEAMLGKPEVKMRAVEEPIKVFRRYS